jgi:hypothetical protein
MPSALLLGPLTPKKLAALASTTVWPPGLQWHRTVQMTGARMALLQTLDKGFPVARLVGGSRRTPQRKGYGRRAPKSTDPAAYICQPCPLGLCTSNRTHGCSLEQQNSGLRPGQA